MPFSSTSATAKAKPTREKTVRTVEKDWSQQTRPDSTLSPVAISDRDQCLKGQKPTVRNILESQKELQTELANHKQRWPDAEVTREHGQASMSRWARD